MILVSRATPNFWVCTGSGSLNLRLEVYVQLSRGPISYLSLHSSHLPESPTRQLTCPGAVCALSWASLLFGSWLGCRQEKHQLHATCSNSSTLGCLIKNRTGRPPWPGHWRGLCKASVAWACPRCDVSLSRSCVFGETCASSQLELLPLLSSLNHRQNKLI